MVPLQQNTGPVSSQDLEACLGQFKNTMTTIQKITAVQKSDDHIKVESLQKNLLNPLEEQTNQVVQKKQNDDNQEFTSIEQLDLGSKTAEEKVKILREHPDLLVKFMRDQQEAKRKEKLALLQKHYEARVRRVEENTKAIRVKNPGYNPPPVPKNFLKINRENLVKIANPVVKMLKLKQKSARLDIKIQLVQQSLNQKLEEKTNRSLKKMAIQAAPPVLPAQFLVQKGKLQALLHLCANLASLRNTSSVYAELHANNERIRAAAITIEQSAKMHIALSFFTRRREESIKIQHLAKLFLLKKRQAMRQKALKRINSFVQRLYIGSCYLGAVGRYQQLATEVISVLFDNQGRKSARQALLIANLEKADYLTTEKTVLGQKQAILNEAFAKLKKKKPGQVAEQAVVVPQEIEDQLIKNKEAIFKEVLEQAYQYIKRSKSQLLEDLVDNKFAGLEEAMFTMDVAELSQFVQKAKELGDTLTEAGEWEKRQDFINWCQELK